MFDLLSRYFILLHYCGWQSEKNGIAHLWTVYLLHGVELLNVLLHSRSDVYVSEETTAIH